MQYNGGVANVKAWKISTYLEVMEGGVPCTNPCLPLLDACVPLLDCVDAMFTHWYKQQHACNKPGQPKREEVRTLTGGEDREGETTTATGRVFVALTQVFPFCRPARPPAKRSPTQ